MINKIKSFLSHPSWQGIAAIIGFIALIVTIVTFVLTTNDKTIDPIKKEHKDSNNIGDITGNNNQVFQVVKTPKSQECDINEDENTSLGKKFTLTVDESKTYSEIDLVVKLYQINFENYNCRFEIFSSNNFTPNNLSLGGNLGTYKDIRIGSCNYIISLISQDGNKCSFIIKRKR